MLIFKKDKYLWIVSFYFWNLSIGTAGRSLLPEASLDGNALDTTGKPGELSKKKCQQYHPEHLVGLALSAGKPALDHEFPHMAAIGYMERKKTKWVCGGALISEKFVLTAAHCLTDQHPLRVRLGDVVLSSKGHEACSQDFTVLRSIPHPSYKSSSRNHDIALLELDREVKFTEFVSPACLNTEKEFDELVLSAVGWGQTELYGKKSKVLQKISVNYIPYKKCHGIHQKYAEDSTDIVVEDFHICAKGDMGKDTCPGDSGGPLQVLNYDLQYPHYPINLYNIVGVTSFGRACAIHPAPGIYTRVSTYVPWIESIVWKNES